jgi:purine-cytosine permease-like protein
VTTSHLRIFLATFADLAFPLLFTQMLAAAVMTAPIKTSYADGYTDGGIGGLLVVVLFPPLGRFGKFYLVLLAISVIANNCPNIYSVSLSMQAMARWTARVPRWI